MGLVVGPLSPLIIIHGLIARIYYLSIPRISSLFLWILLPDALVGDTCMCIIRLTPAPPPSELSVRRGTETETPHTQVTRDNRERAEHFMLNPESKSQVPNLKSEVPNPKSELDWADSIIQRGQHTNHTQLKLISLNNLQI